MKEKADLEGELADLKRQYEALYEAARIKADFQLQKKDRVQYRKAKEFRL